MFPLIVASTLMAAGMISNLDNDFVGHTSHKIYLKPDFFWGLPTSDQLYDEESESYISKKISRPFYKGIDLSYEWEKPNSLYFSAQWTNSIASVKKTLTSSLGETRSYDLEQSFSNIEARVGRSFQQEGTSLAMVPYVALGRYGGSDTCFVEGERYEENVDVLYAALGNKLMFHFGKIFDIGVNLKLMRPVYVHLEDPFMEASLKINEIIALGYEAAAPIVCHLADGAWEIQLEPYLLKLNTNDANRFVGGRLAIGHCF